MTIDRLGCKQALLLAHNPFEAGSGSLAAAAAQVTG
jgi:hypothetical protein